MSLGIVPLVEEHLKDAALLVTARYRKLRQGVPSRHEDVISILRPLSDLAAKTPGVAAIRGGRFPLGHGAPELQVKAGCLQF